MGQQQLLLLVLSTVIVGLATVAGIQAFSESQQQAAQSALVQRANSIASDIAGAANKPAQLGGVDLSSDDNATIANAIGLSSATGIPAEGAGSSAACSITGGGTGSTATVNCGSDGATSGDVTVSVQVDQSDEDDPVADPSITVTS